MFLWQWLLSIFLFSAICSGAATPDLPSGWVVPKRLEKTGCDRAKSDLFTAQGDFDGDHVPDVAKLLAKKEGNNMGVWVWLSRKPDPILAVNLDKMIDGKHDLAITTVAAGKYETACGKGYSCKKNEPKVLVLKTDAINLATCESANSFLHWSESHKKFLRTWMGD